MYQIQRKNHVEESLQLLDAAGNVAHTLTVDINVDDIMARWNRANIALNNAQQAISANPMDESTQQAYGEAVIALLALIFGDEQTNILLEFYQNRYSELMLDIFPFIAEVITPRIEEASKARLDQLENAAKIAKKHG